MSSPAQYIKQLRESNQALAEGMVKYAETIVHLRRELYQAGGANTLDVMDRAYFAGKDAGIAEAAAVAAARSEQLLPPVDIGVDVTSEGTHVVAFYNRPDAVQEMFYSQFHPLAKPEQESEAFGYAKRLAEFIWAKHYKNESPNWTPLPDVLGVLTQIDNMTCGLEKATPEQEPVGYYCENAVGHKFYRRTKPDKVYKPIALYAAPPRKEVVDVTEPDAGALHPKYHYHPTWAIYDAIREGSMSAEQFRHWCNWTAEETLAMVRG
jgi:hypothetical protein